MITSNKLSAVIMADGLVALYKTNWHIGFMNMSQEYKITCIKNGCKKNIVPSKFYIKMDFFKCQSSFTTEILSLYQTYSIFSHCSVSDINRSFHKSLVSLLSKLK